MSAAERFFEQLRAVRASGSAVPETSYYPALSELLNAIGVALKPRVNCIVNLANRGAGIPDGGLFSADQLRKQRDGDAFAQVPARGAIEVKPPSSSLDEVARSEQVRRYLERYRQVLLVSLREWALLVVQPDGSVSRMEHCVLAADEDAFWELVSHPRAAAARHGERLEEMLRRAMLHGALLAAPQDVATLLASYARDARGRIEDENLEGLHALRAALEETLGLHFEGIKGDHFFRSTLVQTLFYGVFSAWVLWVRDKARDDRSLVFDWRTAAWQIDLPVLRILFEQISSRSTLQPLNLVELVEGACQALNRVDRVQFFKRFEEGSAVQYFYEPFLEAFDSVLRKELGVWYTPREIVQYQVSRVDTALREELGIARGLADEHVVVLDPCCGTGTYLVEVLRHVAGTLHEEGGDALLAHDLKHAAQTRIFGFEILPAPFVVAHLQLGLLLARLGAPLGHQERAGVYLTNALTGWEPPKGPKQKVLPFPDLEEEREAAAHVKRDEAILVILGNPPYNGFAGTAVDEERDLSTAYRATVKAPPPQGQGLNDLYVRFYRMAERRIVEGTGRGVISFISNYSWLDGLSFTGMRECYLDVFDRIWIDNLHGDRIISEYAPDGQTSETVFATQGTSVGIKVGTCVSLLSRRGREAGSKSCELRYRDMDQARAHARRAALLKSTVEPGFKLQFRQIEPILELGLPFKPLVVSSHYLSWPLLTDLLPVSFPGVKTSRDDLLVDIDRQSLEARMRRYFDPSIPNEEMELKAPGIATEAGRLAARRVRNKLQALGLQSGRFFRYHYRPFDARWLYWEETSGLLDRGRPDYVRQIFDGNLWLASTTRTRKGKFYSPQVLTHVADLNVIEANVQMFPLVLADVETKGPLFEDRAREVTRANLSSAASGYLMNLPGDTQGLFFHVVAILHAPRYRDENFGALHQDWPRVPLPATRALLVASAELGRQLANLLDAETPVDGVTAGSLRPELRVVGVLSSAVGATLDPTAGDLAVTAGWGHAGKGGITMPGTGRLIERAYTPEERQAITLGAQALGLDAEQAIALLGASTCDVFLNGKAFWRCVPKAVWEYTIGGYQVIKKWLSYRERDLLGRDLKPEEAREVTHIARRIAAIILLHPRLDASYEAVKASTYPWPRSG